MSDIGEPIDVSTTMIERVNELVGDHSVHMGLIMDIILAQNNQPECFMASSRSLTYGFVANVFKSISWHFWLLVKKLERNPCCGFP